MAITKVAVGDGHVLACSPPMSFSMSKLWCEPLWATEPAPRKRHALKKAWVKRWNTAAVQAPTPSAITM